MSKRKILISISTCLFCGALGISLTNAIKGKQYHASFATYTNGDGATYYNTIDKSLTGTELLTELQTLNGKKRQSTVGYGSMGTTPSGQFKYTDYDPNYVKYDGKGQPYGTQISSFYTYTSATSWNREHVWPNSHGGGSNGGVSSPYIDADIHMVRPTIAAENSSRGNSYYVEGMNSNSAGWDPKTAGYNENSRGEAARIILYCVVADPRLELECANSSPSKNNKMGNLETLLKWNLEYPVTQREKNRNEGAEYLQGNRNPFIDHPEYGCKIWGGTNARTKQICSQSTDPVEVEHGSVPEDPLNVTEAIEMAQKYTSEPSPTYYTKGYISSIKNFDSEHGNAEFYISADGTTSGNQLFVYRGAYKNGEKITSVDQIAVGIKVIIAGQLQNYMNNTPEYIQGSYIYAVGSEVDTIAPDVSPDAVLQSITLSGNYKKEFYVGDAFTYEGLIVTAHYSDGAHQTVTPTSVSSPNMSVAGNKTVTVTYAEKSVTKEATYTIMVSEKPIINPTLTGISITKMPNKTSFYIGEEFEYDGLEITAKYSDNSSKVVEPTSVTPPNMETEGRRSVKVSYTEDGKTVIDYYKIDILAKDPTPSPTPSETPVPTEEPTPTPTEVNPTPTPVITPTEEPTPTPVVTPSEEPSPVVSPTPSEDPEPTPAKKKGGCGGSIIASSIIISTTSLLGVGLLLIKKKH